MADRLYLSLWFPSFTEAELMPRLLCVLGKFPFSAARPGVNSITIHPISWNETVIFQESFRQGAEPAHAAALAAEFLHDDYGYEFDAAWDLWSPFQEGGLDETWVLQPSPVTFMVHGEEFDDGTFQEMGHIHVDFGLDAPFLHEEADLARPLIEQRVRANVQKLVEFTQALEDGCGLRNRILWSESEDNLAQKLTARLQRVQ